MSSMPDLENFFLRHDDDNRMAIKYTSKKGNLWLPEQCLCLLADHVKLVESHRRPVPP